MDEPIIALDDEAAPGADPHLITEDEYRAAFGVGLDETLDLRTWRDGDDVATAYDALRDQVATAVKQESLIKERSRAYLLPRLRERDPNMGLFSMPVDEVERIHMGLLWNGQVQVSDGTDVVHDTLPLTVAQIGVCLVNYAGSQSTWTRRAFRRDLSLCAPDPVDALVEALARRGRRSSTLDGRHDQLSELGRRGVMSYMERAVFKEAGSAQWFMGHGPPLPWELLTGSGHMGLLDRSLSLLEWLWLDHKRVVYVPSSVDRAVLTIGNALGPLEYALVETAEHHARAVVDRGHYERHWRHRVDDFVATVAPQIVVGVYRASAHAPAHAFYAHRDYAHLAARIAIADSALQDFRGFPLLIDLADTLCRATFTGGAFFSVVESAYADAGAPYAYLPERMTRRRT